MQVKFLAQGNNNSISNGAPLGIEPGTLWSPGQCSKRLTDATAADSFIFHDQIKDLIVNIILSILGEFHEHCSTEKMV